MAVGMLLAGEAVTKDTYRQVTEKMFGSYPMPEEDSPEGLIMHTAGQSEQRPTRFCGFGVLANSPLATRAAISSRYHCAG